MPFLDETPANWARIEAAARSFHEPGRFVTLLGYEWTSWIFGHRHVLHFEDTASIRSSLDRRFTRRASSGRPLLEPPCSPSPILGGTDRGRLARRPIPRSSR
jgi:hypothetical protein